MFWNMQSWTELPLSRQLVCMYFDHVCGKGPGLYNVWKLHFSRLLKWLSPSTSQTNIWPAKPILVKLFSSGDSKFKFIFVAVQNVRFWWA